MKVSAILNSFWLWWPVSFWVIHVIVAFMLGSDAINVWTVVTGATITIVGLIAFARKLSWVIGSTLKRERIAHEAEVYALAVAHGWTVADREDDGTGKVVLTLLYGDALKQEQERREADRGGK